MELTPEELNLVIQILSQVSIPVNQAEKVLKIIEKLRTPKVDKQ